MLEKKLLTAACALGILMCGDCFLPPVHRTPPPPPPPMRARAIHSICVKVENRSATRHVDPDLFLGWTIEFINGYYGTGWPRAQRDNCSSSADATLQIAVSNETSTAEEADSASQRAGYRYSVQVDAVLTARDGRELWKEVNPTYQSTRLPAPGSADPWRSFAVENWLRFGVCHSLVPRVLNEEP